MRPPNVDPSERSFSPQTVCVWVSGLYAARSLKPTLPGTYTEVLALAADSGVTDWQTVGRANFTKLAAGMKKRYGLIGRVIEGPAAQLAVLEAAAAGPVVVCLAGNQLNLTPHWQNGSIGHAIAVLYPNGTTGTQFDPLAPAGYNGDPFPPAELAKFATATLIFKDTEVTTNDMPGFKAISPPIGRFTFVGVHALISPVDPKIHYLQADNAAFNVVAALDLKTPDGKPVDIEGNSPPQNNRDQVYLVDAQAFGVAAYALRQDGIFTPITAGPTDDELLKARESGIIDARKALESLK